jgi:uncharacterized membrane protein
MKGRLPAILVNVVLLVVTAVLFPGLPAEVPTHWDMHGQVDGTMARFPGAFLGSAMGLGLCILLPLLRRIDPRSKSYDRFDGTFNIVVNAVGLMMAAVQVMTLAVSLGYELDVTRWMMAGVGVMFVVLGNYMPRIRSNWWMGIRTPWTLENEEVWRRTHRFGGRAFVAGGVITVAASLLLGGRSTWVSLAAMMMAGLAPVVYSYVVWRGVRRDA